MAAELYEGEEAVRSSIFGFAVGEPALPKREQSTALGRHAECSKGLGSEGAEGFERTAECLCHAWESPGWAGALVLTLDSVTLLVTLIVAGGFTNPASTAEAVVGSQIVTAAAAVLARTAQIAMNTAE